MQQIEGIYYAQLFVTGIASFAASPVFLTVGLLIQIFMLVKTNIQSSMHKKVAMLIFSFLSTLTCTYNSQSTQILLYLLSQFFYTMIARKYLK
ncbi:Transmembrane domain-containing protein [Spironucleus salmonicida]|uniref:Transmembrane domain-containing protein n=1 Tax=Spironucleus salmonicida TaxID=348837 RepID=V6LLW5_9EUKA|nr:Transmembrane domain-containing protein [Spironucleus salmonicida]|eukprot:EST41694.1 Transmembrane domain-containing protein [Spironucleus salmonicida]